MPSISDSRFKEFLAGLSAPIRVLALLLQHPRLLGLFILPMLITVLFLAVAIYGVLTGVWGLLKDLLAHWLSSGAATWGAGALSALAVLLIAYFALCSLNILIQLAASPFNDLLAEQTERALGLRSSPESLLHLVQVFWIDLRKTLLALTFTAFLLLWGTLPFVGVLSFLGMAWVQAFTFLSYPQSRRRLGLQHSLAWILANPYRTLGFGIACLILTNTPVLNLFALPLCVMAGTMTYLKK
jgi:CysZ protein